MDQRFVFQQSLLRVAAAAAIAGAGCMAGAVILPGALVNADPSGGGSDSSASSPGSTSDKHHTSDGVSSGASNNKKGLTHAKTGVAGAGAASGFSPSRDSSPSSASSSSVGDDRPTGTKGRVGDERRPGVASADATASGKSAVLAGTASGSAQTTTVRSEGKMSRSSAVVPKSIDRSATSDQEAGEAHTGNAGVGRDAAFSTVGAGSGDAAVTAVGSGDAKKLRGRSVRTESVNSGSVEGGAEAKVSHPDLTKRLAPVGPAVTKSAAAKAGTESVSVSPVQATTMQAPVAVAKMVSAPTAAAAEVLAPVAPLRPAPLPPAAPLPPPLAPSAPSGATTTTTSAAPGTRKRSESSGDSVVQPAKKKVLTIAVDGANLDKILKANTPNIKELMKEGTTGPSDLRGHMTLSAPSWTTHLTGVRDDKHGVSDNVYTDEPYKKYPTLFTHIETAKPELKTSSISNWPTMRDISGSGDKPADNVRYFHDEDPTYARSGKQVADETVERIRNGDDLILSYDQQVDMAGHDYGADSPEYTSALERVDANIGKIMEAVRQREKETGEKWTVILTTDHGHTPEGGHGGQSTDETSTFTVARGADFGPGEVNPRFSTVDTTPTILKTLGVPLSPNFDGVDLRTLRNHALKPADLETAIRDIINTNHEPDLLTTIRLKARYYFSGVVGLVDQFLFRGDLSLIDVAARMRMPVISTVAPFVATVLKIISPVVTGAMNLLDGGISRAAQLAGKVVTGAVNLLGGVVSHGMQLADTVAGANIPIISPAAAALATTLRAVGTIVSGAANLFNDGVAGAIRLIVDANIPIISPVAAFIAATSETILKAVGTVVAGAKDLRGALITTLRETIGWLTGVQPDSPSTAPAPPKDPSDRITTRQPEPIAA